MLIEVIRPGDGAILLVSRKVYENQLKERGFVWVEDAKTVNPPQPAQLEQNGIHRSRKTRNRQDS